MNPEQANLAARKKALRAAARQSLAARPKPKRAPRAGATSMEEASYQGGSPPKGTIA